ncbi:hypothetical protein C4565_00640 [Candidatus Parcubacteria bacterium]|nr:MAG: hypothetical protein C4565_00640 [Candidatus Parcubacteria bacterium]
MTPELGKLVTKETGRDAVHMAIAPITAVRRLKPGEHVDANGFPERYGAKPVGIVDPFLREDVLEGQVFLIMLYPLSVTSLRHEWTHPAFPTATPGEIQAMVKEYLKSKRN